MNFDQFRNYIQNKNNNSATQEEEEEYPDGSDEENQSGANLAIKYDGVNESNNYNNNENNNNIFSFNNSNRNENNNSIFSFNNSNHDENSNNFNFNNNNDNENNSFFNFNNDNINHNENNKSFFNFNNSDSSDNENKNNFGFNPNSESGNNADIQNEYNIPIQSNYVMPAQNEASVPMQDANNAPIQSNFDVPIQNQTIAAIPDDKSNSSQNETSIAIQKEKILPIQNDSNNNPQNFNNNPQNFNNNPQNFNNNPQNFSNNPIQSDAIVQNEIDNAHDEGEINNSTENGNENADNSDQIDDTENDAPEDFQDPFSAINSWCLKIRIDEKINPKEIRKYVTYISAVLRRDNTFWLRETDDDKKKTIKNRLLSLFIERDSSIYESAALSLYYISSVEFRNNIDTNFYFDLLKMIPNGSETEKEENHTKLSSRSIKPQILPTLYLIQCIIENEVQIPLNRYFYRYLEQIWEIIFFFLSNEDENIKRIITVPQDNPEKAQSSEEIASFLQEIRKKCFSILNKAIILSRSINIYEKSSILVKHLINLVKANSMFIGDAYEIFRLLCDNYYYTASHWMQDVYSFSMLDIRSTDINRRVSAFEFWTRLSEIESSMIEEGTKDKLSYFVLGACNDIINEVIASIQISEIINELDGIIIDCLLNFIQKDPHLIIQYTMDFFKKYPLEVGNDSFLKVFLDSFINCNPDEILRSSFKNCRPDVVMHYFLQILNCTKSNKKSTLIKIIQSIRNPYLANNMSNLEKALVFGLSSFSQENPSNIIQYTLEFFDKQTKNGIKDLTHDVALRDPLTSIKILRPEYVMSYLYQILSCASKNDPKMNMFFLPKTSALRYDLIPEFVRIIQNIQMTDNLNDLENAADELLSSFIQTEPRAIVPYMLDYFREHIQDNESDASHYTSLKALSSMIEMCRPESVLQYLLQILKCVPNNNQQLRIYFKLKSSSLKVVAKIVKTFPNLAIDDVNNIIAECRNSIEFIKTIEFNDTDEFKETIEFIYEILSELIKLLNKSLDEFNDQEGIINSSSNIELIQNFLVQVREIIFIGFRDNISYTSPALISLIENETDENILFSLFEEIVNQLKIHLDSDEISKINDHEINYNLCQILKNLIMRFGELNIDISQDEYVVTQSQYDDSQNQYIMSQIQYIECLYNIIVPNISFNSQPKFDVDYDEELLDLSTSFIPAILQYKDVTFLENLLVIVEDFFDTNNPRLISIASEYVGDLAFSIREIKNYEFFLNNVVLKIHKSDDENGLFDFYERLLDDGTTLREIYPPLISSLADIIGSFGNNIQDLIKEKFINNNILRKHINAKIDTSKGESELEFANELFEALCRVFTAITNFVLDSPELANEIANSAFTLFKRIHQLKIDSMNDKILAFVSCIVNSLYSVDFSRKRISFLAENACIKEMLLKATKLTNQSPEFKQRAEAIVFYLYSQNV